LVFLNVYVSPSQPSTGAYGVSEWEFIGPDDEEFDEFEWLDDLLLDELYEPRLLLLPP